MKKIKLDFLKRKRKFKKNNTEPNPNIFWIGIFYTSLVFIIVSFVFGFIFFRKINKEETFLPEIENKQLNKIKIERMDSVLDIFSAREKTSKKIQSSSAPVVDPSL